MAQQSGRDGSGGRPSGTTQPGDALRESLSELARLADTLIDDLEDVPAEPAEPPPAVADRTTLRETIDELDKHTDPVPPLRSGEPVLGDDRGEDIDSLLDAVLSPVDPGDGPQTTTVVEFPRPLSSPAPQVQPQVMAEGQLPAPDITELTRDGSALGDRPSTTLETESDEPTPDPPLQADPYKLLTSEAPLDQPALDEPADPEPGAPDEITDDGLDAAGAIPIPELGHEPPAAPRIDDPLEVDDARSSAPAGAQVIAEYGVSRRGVGVGWWIAVVIVAILAVAGAWMLLGSRTSPARDRGSLRPEPPAPTAPVPQAPITTLPAAVSDSLEFDGVLESADELDGDIATVTLGEADAGADPDAPIEVEASTPTQVAPGPVTTPAPELPAPVRSVTTRPPATATTRPPAPTPTPTPVRTEPETRSATGGGETVRFIPGRSDTEAEKLTMSVVPPSPRQAATSAPARPEPVEATPEPQAAPTIVAAPYQPPVVLERHEPVYPARALKRGVNGEVVLRVLVSDTGQVVRVVVADGAGPELEAAAIEAMLRWRYRPAREQGRPVRGWVTERFAFEP